MHDKYCSFCKKILPSRCRKLCHAKDCVHLSNKTKNVDDPREKRIPDSPVRADAKR